MEITRNTQEKVEQAEQAFDELAAQIGPLWGREQSDELARLADELQKAYDEAGTPEDDRIAL